MKKGKGTEGERARIILANRLRQRRSARLEESVPTFTCTPYYAGVIVLYQHIGEADKVYDIPSHEQRSFLLGVTELSRAYHLSLRQGEQDEHGHITKAYLARPVPESEIQSEHIYAVLHLSEAGKGVSRVSFTKGPLTGISDVFPPQQGARILRFPR